jgi:UDP-N-acetylmuramoyl-L-alanyl-D-glutamate--2,6-diaminopimelate ligase
MQACTERAGVNLDRLIAGLQVTADEGGAGVDLARVRITDITEDSRTVMPGSLFIARVGARTDGRRMIPSAVKAGAVAVLVEGRDPLPSGITADGAVLLRTPDVPLALAQIGERFYGEPSRRLAVVGVTGTNGKTTVSWLVHGLLNGQATGSSTDQRRRGTALPTGEGVMRPGACRCGLMGTVVVDDGAEVAPATLTTPPALEVSRTLARMLECGCRAAVLEASSIALDQRRVGAPGGAQFRIGVFTNLTHDHLDYHGTMERYADSKARLFESLPPDGVAVVNADDPATPRMLRDCRARVVRCSMRARHSTGDPRPDWFARVLRTTASGTECQIEGPWEHPHGTHAPGLGATGVGWHLRLGLIGAHNVMNALQAAAVAYELGLPPEAIRDGLERAGAPPGRLERVTGWDDPLAVYVDYAHTDDALARVLGVLRGVLAAQGHGRLWCVFGCGGDRDRSKRPKMGAVASSLSDRAVITSDNPRTEDPRAIVEQILAGVSAEHRARVRVELDRAAAIQLAVREAQAGDILLIAGKGHEKYQILPDGRGGTVVRSFDDVAVAGAALSARGMGTRAGGGAHA